MEPASSAEAVLDFAFRQSYLKDIGPTEVSPAPVVPRRAGPVRRLGRSLSDCLKGVAFPVAGVAGAAVSATADPVGTLLSSAMGLQRYEPFNPYNPHAAVPSARGAFAAEAYVVDDSGAWRFVPARHELEQVAARDVGGGTGSGSFDVWVVARATAFPSGYRELRSALALLEAGHCIANLVTVGMALGLHSRVRLAFSDRRVLGVLGLDPDAGWLPCAILTFSTDRSVAADGPSAVDAAGGGHDVTAAAGGDEVSIVDRAGWLDAEAGAWPSLPLPLPAEHAVRPVVPSEADLPWVLWQRNAGRAPGGLSASLRPVPARALLRAVTEAGRRELLWGSTGAAEASAGLRFFWVVERVEGVEDGLYEYVADARQLVPRRHGRLLARVQEGFSYPPEATSVETMNIAGLTVVDLAAVIDRYGPRGWRLANLEMGAAAQAAALALAADGLFARPCRSFHEYVLDELLGLEASEVVGYELLSGANRFTDLTFDLRP